jgi:uncharacterized SAM-binding protein YcdF (DUF218 family)
VASRWPLRTRILLALIAVALAAIATHSLWLPIFGYALIRNDGPARADIAVVPAGDYYGHRIEKAGDLVRQGYVPLVLVSGPYYYGVSEADLAISMAVRAGYPAAWFAAYPNQALATRDEAATILRELKRRDIHQFLLVTSDYHTARAARLYRSAERSDGGGPGFRTVSAPSEHFDPGAWWKDREGQKTVVLEWMKTVATFLGK